MSWNWACKWTHLYLRWSILKSRYLTNTTCTRAALILIKKKTDFFCKEQTKKQSGKNVSRNLPKRNKTLPNNICYWTVNQTTYTDTVSRLKQTELKNDQEKIVNLEIVLEKQKTGFSMNYIAVFKPFKSKIGFNFQKNIRKVWYKILRNGTKTSFQNICSWICDFFPDRSLVNKKRKHVLLNWKSGDVNSNKKTNKIYSSSLHTHTHSILKRKKNITKYLLQKIFIREN